MMVNKQNASDGHAQALSALVDGESLDAELTQACQAWRDDPDARAQWHTYHLIGDVLRSEDLASSPARDAAFLNTLRSRLADEPVPLAPEPLAARAAPVPTALPKRRLQFLVAPAAVAAGFVAVAVSVVVVRGPAQQPATPAMAQAPAPSAATGVAVAADDAARQAGLARYLGAHRRVSNGLATGVAAGAAHNVDLIVIEDK